MTLRNRLSQCNKGLFFILILVWTTNMIFAYDGEVFGGHDGNLTRFAFIQQASNTDLAAQILRNTAGNNVRIDKLFSLGENDVDEEDVQMLNDLERYISQQFRVSNGDAFSYFVKRGSTNNIVDGWIVFSHYVQSSGWFHYVYYFSTSQ